MTKRVEEIRRRVHHTPGSEVSLLVFNYDDMLAVLTALAQAERGQEGAKAEGYSIGYKEGLERGTNEARAEVERLKADLAAPVPTEDDMYAGGHVRNLEAALAQAEREREASIVEVNRLADDLSAAQAEVERLKAEVAGLIEERNSLRTPENFQMALALDEIRELRAEVDECKRIHATLLLAEQTHREKLEAEVERLKDDYAREQEENIYYQDATEKAHAALARVREEHVNLLQRIKEENDRCGVPEGVDTFTYLSRVRAIDERAKQMLYVAGCRDDGISEEMRILWRVLGIDGPALEDRA